MYLYLCVWINLYNNNIIQIFYFDQRYEPKQIFKTISKIVFRFENSFWLIFLENNSHNAVIKENLSRILQYSSFKTRTRAAVVHLNFQAGSTFPDPVCTVPSSMDRTSRCNKVDEVRLYSSYRLNLLLLNGQRCVLKMRPTSVS